MPISGERVPNRPLSGQELKDIILKDVAARLDRDGMFSVNIAYGRVSYEVRVSLHMDNPVYPEHISETLSKGPSDQELEANPPLGALEPPPLSDPSEDAAIFSEETARKIESANVARVEAGMPIPNYKRNLDTGQVENKPIHFTGDLPDPAEVGNVNKTTNTSIDQKDKWSKGRKK